MGMAARTLALLLPLALLAVDVAAAELPIFDAHVHYSHDAWDNLPPKDAIAILRKAGLKRALVSSSGDEGTQRLVAEAPDLVLPSLRPYRRRGDVSTWVRDDTVVAFLEERLRSQRYVAIGEFHLYGADAELPVPRRMVALARQYQLVLHAHSDADAVERLFRQDPDARIRKRQSMNDRWAACDVLRPAVGWQLSQLYRVPAAKLAAVPLVRPLP